MITNTIKYSIQEAIYWGILMPLSAGAVSHTLRMAEFNHHDQNSKRLRASDFPDTVPHTRLFEILVLTIYGKEYANTFIRL